VQADGDVWYKDVTNQEHTMRDMGPTWRDRAHAARASFDNDVTIASVDQMYSRVTEDAGFGVPDLEQGTMTWFVMPGVHLGGDEEGLIVRVDGAFSEPLPFPCSQHGFKLRLKRHVEKHVVKMRAS
jgi:hypothetical protein